MSARRLLRLASAPSLSRAAAPLAAVRRLASSSLSAAAATPPPPPAAAAPVEHWLLEYAYDAPDEASLVARRAAVRPAHLAHARAAKAAGTLVSGGAAFGSPPASPAVAGVLVFARCSRADVEAFARADPYVTTPTADTGRPLVSSFSVRRWAVVI